MRDTTTFIKLDRNIAEWRWFKEPNTLAVWIWLLINANFEPQDFRNGTLERGEICCTFEKIAEGTGLSKKSVRTAMERLLKTGEISKKGHEPKYPIYIIEGFSRYQDYRALKGHEEGTQTARKGHEGGTQGARGKELKELKKERIKEYKNGERAPARVGARKESVASILDRMLAEAEAEEEAQREPSGNGTNNPDA